MKQVTKKPIGKTAQGHDVWDFTWESPEVKAVGENEIELIGSTEHQDRHGEVVRVDGWDLKNFKKNPVVLASHAYDQPAIGKAKVRVEDKHLVFRIEFAPSGLYPLADIYKGLYKSGIMRASSVGFIGMEYEYGKKESDPVRTFTKQELLEISLVSIPANPQALMADKCIIRAVKEGVIREKDVKELERFVRLCFEKERPQVFSIPKMEGFSDDDDDKTESTEDEKESGTPTPGDSQAGAADTTEQNPTEVSAAWFGDLIKHLTPEIKAAVYEAVKEAMTERRKADSHYINDVLDGLDSDESTDPEAITEVATSLKNAFKR